MSSDAYNLYVQSKQKFGAGNYQEALGMYQKAETLEVKDKSRAKQKIKEIVYEYNSFIQHFTLQSS